MAELGRPDAGDIERTRERRRRIRQALDSGALPHVPMTPLYSIVGGGQRCGGCGEVVNALSIEGLSRDGAAFTLHIECFHLMEIECGRRV